MRNINRNLVIAITSFFAIIIAGFLWAIAIYISKKFGIKIFDNYMINNISLKIFILVCQYFVIKKYNDGKFSLDFIGMKVKPNSYKQLLVGIGMGSLMYLIWILILSINNIIKFKGIGFMFYPMNKVIIYIINAFLMAAFAGFVEEITLRGIILNQLMQFKGKVFAIIISSLIFAMLHIQYYSDFKMLFCVFISGVLLGYLYILTGSLFLSIGFHFAVDFLMTMSNNINNFLVFNFKVNYYSVMSFVTKVQICTISIVTLFIISFDVIRKLRNIK